MFAANFLALLDASFATVFSQSRTCTRAIELALGMLCSFGRRTISRAICAIGRQNQDWSADYKLFSRSRWKEDALFDPIIDDYLHRYPKRSFVVAFDDTKCPKTGTHIASAFWQRDPMSPPFHPNLVYGLRFMQVSLLYPHHQEGEFSARGLPVRFVECPVVKKPGKRAGEQEWLAYKLERKKRNLSTQGLEIMKGLRADVDRRDPERRIVAVLDGSLCNQTIFKASIDRFDLLARCRKDAVLCLKAPERSRRFYAPDTLTPEQVRKNETIPWRETTVFYGGARRTIRYKTVENVYWRVGAGRRPLRLIVLAPQPYKNSQNGRTHYRQPGYLLTTSLTDDCREQIQMYLDRWQIEVNHRDEKQILGVGQAQVRSTLSVPRQPAFAVAGYSLMLLAALQSFGPGRTDHFITLPKWRKSAKRPSALDLVTLLRQEMNEMGGYDRVGEQIRLNIGPYAYT
jgi:hypothetical protein